jgi:hypothetical protein
MSLLISLFKTSFIAKKLPVSVNNYIFVASGGDFVVSLS